MALMLGALYDALKDATTDDKARKAAEEAAGYDNRLAKIESDLVLVKWMLGVVVAGVAALIVKAFF